MRKLFFFSTFLLLFFSSAGQMNCYRVVLADKEFSPYSFSRPDEFLSQRALAKRDRFQIAITEKDLPVSPFYIEDILAIHADVRLLSKSKWDNSVTVFCPNEQILDSILARPYVVQVLPVGHVAVASKTGAADISPADNMLKTDYTTADYGYAYPQIAIHNGHLLHQAGFRGEGMLIAVIDGGWSNFEELDVFQHLHESGRLIGTYDFAYGNVFDRERHGTCVTSIMAAFRQDSILGVAPAADYFLIRSEIPECEQLIEEDFWAAAVEMADSLGADVINSSLGYTTFDDTTQYYDYRSCDGVSSIASRAASLATERGMVVCVSAGNSGTLDWHYISRPADAKEILTVGAVSKDSLYAPFSSTGPTYDGRVKPDVASVGWNTYVVDIDGSIRTSNGTSFASPVIAGLSACLWQALPEKSAPEIMQIIRENAHQFNHPDSLMGFGIPDFYRAYMENRPDTASGVEAVSQIDAPFTLFPNPCSLNINIVYSGKELYKYRITDAQGRCVYAMENYSTDHLQNIDVADWASGIYFLQTTTATGRVCTIKFVRQ